MKNQHEDRDFNHTFADENFDDSTVVPLAFVSEFDRNDQPGPSNLSWNAYASDVESAPNQTTKLLNVYHANIVETEMTEMRTRLLFMRSLGNLSLLLHHLFMKKIMIMNWTNHITCTM